MVVFGLPDSSYFYPLYYNRKIVEEVEEKVRKEEVVMAEVGEVEVAEVVIEDITKTTKIENRCPKLISRKLRKSTQRITLL